MGAPSHIVLPEKGSAFPSPRSSIFSPSGTESSTTPSSVSISDSSSPSFAHPDSTCALAPIRPPSSSQSRQEITFRHQKQDSGDGNAVCVGLPAKDAIHSQKCTCTNSLGGSERALMGSCKTSNVRISMRKACCRCAGAFAADCAALCCCPCAIISLLAFMLVELPSALATRMITNLKKRLSIKGVGASSASRHGDEGHHMSTPTRTQKESSRATGEVQAIHLIRFDTENLLKHFEAENVGFGCLSQKRD